MQRTNLPRPNLGRTAAKKSTRRESEEKERQQPRLPFPAPRNFFTMSSEVPATNDSNLYEGAIGIGK